MDGGQNDERTDGQKDKRIYRRTDRTKMDCRTDAADGRPRGWEEERERRREGKKEVGKEGRR